MLSESDRIILGAVYRQIFSISFRQFFNLFRLSFLSGCIFIPSISDFTSIFLVSEMIYAASKIIRSSRR